jgi:hypothetical protein
LLFACCSDGAGSAAHGGAGAELVVAAARHWFDTRIAGASSPLCTKAAETCLQAVRDRLFALAADLEVHPRELASTLLIAIVAPEEALFAQLGDGGIVIESDGALDVPIWPHEGEFANSTYFTTDEGAPSRLSVVRTDTLVTGVALFTDGLQRLTLDFAARTVHAPFFLPLFTHLRRCADVDARSLDEALARMLESSAINDRTDDDKTLVLATTRG